MTYPLPLAHVLMTIALMALTTASSRSQDVKPTEPTTTTTVHAADFRSLQAAFDALLDAAAGVVRLPAATIEIREPIVVRSGDILIQGAGPASHIHNANAEGKSAFMIASGRPAANQRGSTEPLWRVQLSNFRLTGNSQSGHGIEARFVNEIYVDGVTISQHGGDGVHLHFCYEDPRVNDALLTYNKGAGLYAIGCHDTVVAACHFEENRDAIRFVDGFNLTATGNNIDDHLQHGIVIENSMGNTVSGNMIEQCAGIGVVLERDTYGTTVSSNIFTNDRHGGVALRDAHGCTITGNTFSRVPQRAVSIDAESHATTVNGNTFADSSVGDGTYKGNWDLNMASGIVLQGASLVNITGNTFSNLKTKALTLDGKPARSVVFSSNLLLNTASDHDKLVDSVVRGNLETTEPAAKATAESGARETSFRALPQNNPTTAAPARLAAVEPKAEPGKPLALHPGNPHYFVWQGKPTILITSGEHYGALLNLDFDYVRYFDELKSHGLNHTRTFTGVYRENPAAFRITDNTLAPKPNRYVCPWARSQEPGYKGGGNKFDLTKWDAAYFERLKDFMTKAQQRGIVVELTLFCPMYNDGMWQISPMNVENNVNDIGKCSRTEVYTLKQPDLLDVQLAVTRKLVTELRQFDNLYYEVCNEPYFGGVTTQWQHKMIDAIVETEKDSPTKHLISMNISNGRQKVERPHAAVSIFNFHYCVPPDTVAMNYGLDKVIGENETGFRGRDDVLYRTEGWDFLLAGGGLYNNLDYSFTAQHPDGRFRDYKSPGGGSVELRQQLGILKRFLDGFDFLQMKPDNSVIRKVQPELTASALVEPGKAYAIYMHVPLPNKPKHLRQHLRDDIEANITFDLPAGSYSADWVNTKTGSVDKRDTFDHAGGNKQISSPRFSSDIALRLLRR